MSDEKSFSVCQEMLPLFRAVLNHYSFKSSVDWLKYDFLHKLNDLIKCKMFLLHGKGQTDTFMKTINEPVIMSRYF